MTNLQVLEMVGKGLYGDQWQSPIARDLDVAIRTVQRWIAGDRETPDLSGELREIIERRRTELGALLAKVPKSAERRTNSV